MYASHIFPSSKIKPVSLTRSNTYLQIHWKSYVFHKKDLGSVRHINIFHIFLLHPASLQQYKVKAVRCSISPTNTVLLSAKTLSTVVRLRPECCLSPWYYIMVFRVICFQTHDSLKPFPTYLTLCKAK